MLKIFTLPFVHLYWKWLMVAPCKVTLTTEDQVWTLYSRTCAYQGERNVHFSKNLVCFVFLQRSFCDSPYCHRRRSDAFTINFEQIWHFFIVDFEQINLQFILSCGLMLAQIPAQNHQWRSTDVHRWKQPQTLQHLTEYLRKN